MELLKRENGIVWQAHPRTKGSAGDGAFTEPVALK
jgi:hypothetical protein